MQGVSFREDIMDGRSEDPASAWPVQISVQDLRKVVLPLENQAAQAVLQDMFLERLQPRSLQLSRFLQHRPMLKFQLRSLR